MERLSILLAGCLAFKCEWKNTTASVEHQARKLSEETFTQQQARARGLETLGRFHETVLRTFSEAVMPQHTDAVAYLD